MTNTSDAPRVMAEDVLPFLKQVSKAGKGWLACCPVPEHEDSEPSFSIRDGEKDIIFTCHSGCDRQVIHQALRELGAIPPLPPKEKIEKKKVPLGEPVGEYVYTNEHGEPVIQVLKYKPKGRKKTYRQKAFVGGKWVPSLETVKEFYPYRLPEFHISKRSNEKGDRAIMLFEGEKDADRAHDEGLLGTTLPMGAGKWKDEYAKWFTDRQVFIVPDNDIAGRNHANMVAAKLHPVAQEVKIVELPNEKDVTGWDFSDYMDSGGDVGNFSALVKKTKKWKPESRVKVKKDDKPKSSVAHVDFEKKKTVTVEPYIPSDREAHWTLIQKQLKRNNEGAIDRNSINNAALFLEHHPDMIGKIIYNKRANCAWMSEPFPWDSGMAGTSRQLRDTDRTGAVQWLEQHGLNCKASMAIDLINKIAESYPFDYLTDWLTSLEWDGKERINSMLADYFGAKGNAALHSLISQKFMIGAAARALKPGCQNDVMLVLEGLQGIKKSTGLEALFSADYFCDQLPHLSKASDAAMQLAGHWCVEVQEMQTMAKAEYNRIKEFLSVKVDKYRPPFGRHPIAVPRCCVFVGTINPESGYLKDPTGARRFWPVYVHGVDVEKIKQDRAQLWAEAVAKFNDGYKWWFEEEFDGKEVYENLSLEQRRRFDHDIWTEDIITFMAENHLSRPTTKDVAEKCLGFSVDKLTPQIQSRIAKTLTSIGCKQTRSGNVRAWKVPEDIAKK